jgi:hypothetical protein
MEESGKREREEEAPSVQPVDGAADDAEQEAPAAKLARADDAPAAADAPAGGAASRPGGKKRKVVVMLGYVGAGYQGMQRNPGARTVEDELERAFHAAGGISEDNMGSFVKARPQCGVCVALQRKR